MVIGMDDKIKTVVRIAGQEYRLTGYESEEYMHRVAIYVDRKMTEIGKSYPDLNTTMVAVLAALNIADELIRERVKKDEFPELPAAVEQVPVPREKPAAGENVAVLKKGRIKF